MLIEPLFALMLINFIGKKVDPALVNYNLRKYTRAGQYIVIGLLLSGIVSDYPAVDFIVWLGVLGLMLVIYSRPEFNVTRPLMYSMLPYLFFSLVSEVVQAVDHGFYLSYKSAFESARLFGMLWFGAMWFVNRNQRRALERAQAEREAAAERARIMAEVKSNLEKEVSERTAELRRQKEELEEALEELKRTQAQLIQSEKMASLGELTAGIAHEIQNPLNFVNNFSEVSIELLDELKAGPLQNLPSASADEAAELIIDLTQNLEKINFHGKRADSIVKNMLQHSRASTGKKEETDINALADEYLRLSYHGLRAKDKGFTAIMNTDFGDLPRISAVPQDLGRVLLNLFNNAFYSVRQKQLQVAEGYTPTVGVVTRLVPQGDGQFVEITVSDNGLGIPASVLDKIYQPFFTTKPTGDGTGLGLSMSYDIIHKMHGGELLVDTIEGEYANFIIKLPA